MSESSINPAPDEIQFEELKSREVPAESVPPDENVSLEVASIGHVGDAALKVFVDFDVMLNMVEHVCSNTAVELGGVLLGQYWNVASNPTHKATSKVWISDSIRAEHYQSTRGSFKFTHETWRAITHQRQRRDASLNVIGWYHSHPNWGVFLSGMDRFICESFFKNWFDVAVVIDPIQKDVGLFTWAAGQTEPVRKSGYHLTTQRTSKDRLAGFDGSVQTWYQA